MNCKIKGVLQSQNRGFHGILKCVDMTTQCDILNVDLTDWLRYQLWSVL